MDAARCDGMRLVGDMSALNDCERPAKIAKISKIAKSAGRPSARVITAKSSM